MEFTQQEMLAALEHSGRNDWTLRQMTALRNEGFLPPLKRESQPGTNWPRYVWYETDIDQIVDAYDWWSYYGGDRASLILALWIQGYNVPLDLLRRTYLTIVERYLQVLTHRKTDPDDILDEVSKSVVVWMRKVKFSPGLTDQRKKMVKEQHVSMEQMELFIEKVLSAIAVPTQEFDAGEDLEDVSTDFSEDEEFFVEFEDVKAVLSDIFTLSHLHEAIRTATPEQWRQARTDYLCFCDILSIIAKRGMSAEEDPLPEYFIMDLKFYGAAFLITPLLSTRYYGYGQWIDMAFEKIHELLADPAAQERILTLQKARRTIEADVGDSEKPGLSILE